MISKEHRESRPNYGDRHMEARTGRGGLPGGCNHYRSGSTNLAGFSTEVFVAYVTATNSAMAGIFRSK